MRRPVRNPPNPFLSGEIEWLGPPPAVQVEVWEERAGSILVRNESPDVPFTWSVNPYRGCLHACAYCYARPRHEYLGWGAGTDFETRLVAKVNAPELLRAGFDRPSWKGELVAFSGDTDCYQPLEASYRLTRRCLEVCLEYKNPVGVVTKGALVRRDLDLLRRLCAETSSSVVVSAAFVDETTARLVEPSAPPPSLRFAALRELAEAGVPTGVLVAPVIPGLNDSEVPAVLEAAADAGARDARLILLRLPGSVRPVFLERLREALPGRARRVEARLSEVRGGALTDPRFHRRHAGRGPYWDAVSELFELHRRRLGLTAGLPPAADTFRRPGPRQLELF